VALLVVAAAIAAPFAPMLPLWFGIVLLLLCVATFFPRVQGLSRRLLRLDPSEKWRSTIRLTTYALIGLVLILAGATVAGREAEQSRIAAQQAAEEAEQQRLANEANVRVAAVVRKAEEAWKYSLWALAEKRLQEASRIPNATELAPIGQLRNRMANAKVDALVGEATEALKAGDIDTGSKKVQAALAVPHADNLSEASSVQQQIRYATDPDRVWLALMGLPDEVFLRLEEDGAIPTQLLSGYEVLDARAADLTLAQIEQVAAARDKRRQAELAAQKQRQEEQRLAAEAARRAEERRIAEAKRQQEELERHSIPLVVESWRWYPEYGYAIAEGEVTNRSDIRLERVEVLVSFYTADGQFITSSSALVEYNPILPGQTTPFKVYATQNPQMASARLVFKHLLGGTIPYTKR
jgi:hypothetical protein